MKVKSLSRVRLFASPWTAAHQAPLSMGFARQDNEIITLTSCFLAVVSILLYAVSKLLGNFYHLERDYGTQLQPSCLENPMDGGAW